MTARPHTGRARNPATRRAVLDAALALLEAGSPVTVEGVARRAGVGKQTIYRWWPSAGAVVFEAAMEIARTQVPDPDTGTLRGDLEAFLDATFAGARVPRIRAVLRTLMAESLRDAELAASFHAFLEARRGRLLALLGRAVERGELAPERDLAMLVDLVYGFLWYRVLVGHRPTTSADARMLTALIAGSPGGA
jgi:AcrR family transcriptional regulator